MFGFRFMASPEKESPYSASNRKRGLLIAAASVLVIAAADIVALPDIPLGFLYLYPIIIGGGFLTRWQVLLVSGFCAWLAWHAHPVTSPIDPQMVLVVGGFTVAGLFAAQLGQNRRRLEQQLMDLDTQQNLRREAEEDLRALIETSTASILSLDSEGIVLIANRSAEMLLGFEEGALKGKSVIPYLPFMAGMLKKKQVSRTFRAMAEGRGRRRDGSLFFANVWFSTYTTSFGSRLAAIIWDASEQVREREEVGLRQLLSSSRIFMGAMSHEVRNLCAAISVVHLNLTKKPSFAQDSDFEAMGRLVESLRQLASAELKASSASALDGIDLQELLEELQMIAAPSAEEAQITIQWEIQASLPLIWADRSAVLQVLLNLLNNAVRAASEHPDRQVSVIAYVLHGTVVVRICNRGGIIEAPQQLFQPFKEAASATGLGLYVSRAILRTFGGELRYVPDTDRHCFTVEFKQAAEAGESEQAE